MYVIAHIVGTQYYVVNRQLKTREVEKMHLCDCRSGASTRCRSPVFMRRTPLHPSWFTHGWPNLEVVRWWLVVQTTKRKKNFLYL